MVIDPGSLLLFAMIGLQCQRRAARQIPAASFQPILGRQKIKRLFRLWRQNFKIQ